MSTETQSQSGSESESPSTLKQLYNYVTNTNDGRGTIFMVNLFGAVLTIVLSWYTLKDVTTYTQNYPNLASMGNMLTLIYIISGGITGVLSLYFILIRPESNAVKIIGAIVLVVADALNAIMLLTAGIFHIFFHIQNKGDIMSACLSGANDSLVKNILNPDGTPETVAEYCQNNYRTEKINIIIGVGAVAIYFGIALMCFAVAHYNRMKKQRDQCLDVERGMSDTASVMSGSTIVSSSTISKA